MDAKERAAWREARKAELTEVDRKHYERLRKDGRKKIRDTLDAFRQNKQSIIEEEKRKALLEHPKPVLKPDGATSSVLREDPEKIAQRAYKARRNAAVRPIQEKEQEKQDKFLGFQHDQKEGKRQQEEKRQAREKERERLLEQRNEVSLRHLDEEQEEKRRADQLREQKREEVRLHLHEEKARLELNRAQAEAKALKDSRVSRMTEHLTHATARKMEEVQRKKDALDHIRQQEEEEVRKVEEKEITPRMEAMYKRHDEELQAYPLPASSHDEALGRAFERAAEHDSYYSRDGHEMGDSGGRDMTMEPPKS